MSRFVWNDGGRAAAGYVGHCGDCAVRAIAIATGQPYREVYDALRETKGTTPRNGCIEDDYQGYLMERGWSLTRVHTPFNDSFVAPPGVVVVDIARRSGYVCHLCCMVDGTLVDTWDPRLEEWSVTGVWTNPEQPVPVFASEATSEESAEMDKVLRRLRAMDRTIKDNAATQGERENAIRMMQTMMLRHKVRPEDLQEIDPGYMFTKKRILINGRHVLYWERRLATYIEEHVVPLAQHYLVAGRVRSSVVFYGPKADVEYAAELYRELLVTIATAAQLEAGGYARGRGASFAEGMVAGLPRLTEQHEEGIILSPRALSIHSAAKDWLKADTGAELVSSYARSRKAIDLGAVAAGRIAGARQEVSRKKDEARIGVSLPKLH